MYTTSCGITSYEPSPVKVREVTIELEYPDITDKKFLSKVEKLKAHLASKGWKIKEVEIFINTK